tara:strand:+ start:1707 stop:3578 length:1872 start_codon:yes stop_codon:yes gene_type:complete
MATNPLAGLSRYINVRYREPKESVVDSIFGSFSERTDREIVKANLELERERLRGNADLAQRRYNQERLDKGRRNLNTDIINTLNVTKGLPYFMQQEQIEKIAGSYVPILGQEVVDEVVGVSNPLNSGKGDGYATKSRNNYEITNRISNQGLVTTPEQLLQLNSLFAFDGDGVEGYGVALNKASKRIMIKNKPLAELWENATSINRSFKLQYSDISQKLLQEEISIGLKTGGGESEVDAQNRLIQYVGEEKVDRWQETVKGQRILQRRKFLSDADKSMNAYKRYEDNPFLFIQENIEMPDTTMSDISQEVLDVARKTISEADSVLPNNVMVNLNLNNLPNIESVLADSTVITPAPVPEPKAVNSLLEDDSWLNVTLDNDGFASAEEYLSSQNLIPTQTDTMTVAQSDTIAPVEVNPLQTVDTDNILSNNAVKVQSGEYPSPLQMFETMSMAESSGNPDAERVNDSGSIDVGLVQINSDNVLEPGNEFGGDSNKIIKKGPDQGKPDLLWAKAQEMFRQEFGGLEGEGGADWDKLDDRGKMNFVKSNLQVQKKFFNMWYAQRPADFKALDRAMNMYNQNRPATALNQVADVAMGNVGSDDIVRTELDSLDLTASYNFEEASSDSLG